MPHNRSRNAFKEKKGSLVAQSMLRCCTIDLDKFTMISAILTFLSQKILLIAAALGSLYVLWLKRSETKAKEEAKDAHFVSLQAKATQDQVETLVKQAQNVVQKQATIDVMPVDRDAIHGWLSEQSDDRSTNSMPKESHAKSLRDDSAAISKATSKNH